MFPTRAVSANAEGIESQNSQGPDIERWRQIHSMIRSQREESLQQASKILPLLAVLAEAYPKAKVTVSTFSAVILLEHKRKPDDARIIAALVAQTEMMLVLLRCSFSKAVDSEVENTETIENFDEILKKYAGPIQETTLAWASALDKYYKQKRFKKFFNTQWNDLFQGFVSKFDAHRCNLQIAVSHRNTRCPSLSIEINAISQSHHSPLDVEAFSRESSLCLDGQIAQIGRNAVAGGGYADIWKGTYGNKLVAIKKMRYFDSNGSLLGKEKMMKRLWREYIVWSSITHPNILSCLGFTRDFSSQEQFQIPALISPWMSNGTISSYIQSRPDMDRLPLIVGIAAGLSFLHARDPPVVHGDLKASNVLVSDEGTPCLTDFGLSRVLGSIQGFTTTGNTGGSIRWMSPELFNNGKHDTLSDVWAFGMTVLETITAQLPYYDILVDATVFSFIMRGVIPSRPKNSSPALTDNMWQLCKRCWKRETTDRPSMVEIEVLVKGMITT